MKKYRGIQFRSGVLAKWAKRVQEAETEQELQHCMKCLVSAIEIYTAVVVETYNENK
jgi:hypothetical protein